MVAVTSPKPMRAPDAPGAVAVIVIVSPSWRKVRGSPFTWGGAEPVTVNGEPRTFLHDGDTVTITATAPGASGARIGFGEVTATILPTRSQHLPAEH